MEWMSSLLTLRPLNIILLKVLAASLSLRGAGVWLTAALLQGRTNPKVAERKLLEIIICPFRNLNMKWSYFMFRNQKPTQKLWSLRPLVSCF